MLNMRVISLTCDKCRAPLEIPAKTEFVTCTYCSSRLAVQRSGNAVDTEVLESANQVQVRATTSFGPG